jgi:hypothetical protein
MPQIQTFNFDKPREPTNLERTLQSFSQQNVVNQEKRQDADALGSIYKQFQNDGQNIRGQMEAIHSHPTLGPTAKVNAIDSLTKYANYNKELQEKTEKRMKEEKEMAANKAQVAAIAKHRGQSEEEAAAFYNDPKQYELLTRPQKEKAAPGGLAGIPMSAEEGKTYERILKENPDATADELSVAFGKSDLPPGRYSGAVETRRRIDETKAKNQVEEKKITRAEELQFHKETEKYDEELGKAAKGAKNQLESINNVEKSIERGGDSRKTLANVFRGMGTIGQKISDALLSKDQATIQASIPDFLEGRKELFGVRLSDADLKLLQDKLPDMGKSPEANKAILKLMKKYSEKAVLREEIGREIKKQNKGLRPLGYADQIEERFDQYMKPVKMISPKGKEIDVPAYKVSDAITAGGKLVQVEGESDE